MPESVVRTDLLFRGQEVSRARVRIAIRVRKRGGSSGAKHIEK